MNISNLTCVKSVFFDTCFNSQSQDLCCVLTRMDCGIELSNNLHCVNSKSCHHGISRQTEKSCEIMQSLHEEIVKP